MYLALCSCLVMSFHFSQSHDSDLIPAQFHEAGTNYWDSGEGRGRLGGWLAPTPIEERDENRGAKHGAIMAGNGSGVHAPLFQDDFGCRVRASIVEMIFAFLLPKHLRIEPDRNVTRQTLGRGPDDEKFLAYH